MDQVKGALSSKTVWGGVLAAAAPVVGHFLHVNITDVDVQQLADYAAAAVAVIGGITAVVGRIVATKKIG